MGVPVLSLEMPRFVGRTGRSFLETLDLPQLCVSDPEDYLERAIDLARQTDELQELRNGLRDRMLSSRLMQPKEFTAQFEQALVAMC